MKKYFILSLLSVFVIQANAQTAGQVANYSSSGGAGYSSIGQLNAVLGPISDTKQKLATKQQNFQGSPYTSDLFLPTTLFYGEENLGELYYRYNAFNEEIEIKKTNLDTEGIRALGRDKKIAVLVNGKPMSFKTFIDKKGLTQNGYLTLIKAGKYALYQRTDIKYTEGQKAQNSFVPAIPPRFSQFTEYYLEVDGKNRIDELELSNRKLLKLVADDDKESLKAFLKENKLKISDEKEVMEALDFLNGESS